MEVDVDKPKVDREWVVIREGLWQSIFSDSVTLAMLLVSEEGG